LGLRIQESSNVILLPSPFASIRFPPSFPSWISYLSRRDPDSDYSGITKDDRASLVTRCVFAFSEHSSPCAEVLSAESGKSTGFDPPGAAHFGGKLVGSRKWIGTTEVYTALTFLGIRQVAFDRATIS